MTLLDRTELSRLLAKSLAYANCGKADEASRQAAALLRALIAAGVLSRADLGQL